MYRRWIGAALALLLLLGAAGSVLALERLCVHYIDVGQGEAAFLAGPDFAVLIDAGDLDGTEVLDYLKALGVETIDLFVVTHPHADHIGQAAQVMRSFTVREVWMSGYEHYTRIFEELLDGFQLICVHFTPKIMQSYRFFHAILLSSSSLLLKITKIPLYLCMFSH